MFAGGALGDEKALIVADAGGRLSQHIVRNNSLGAVGPAVPDVNVFNMPFVFGTKRDAQGDRR